MKNALLLVELGVRRALDNLVDQVWLSNNRRSFLASGCRAFGGASRTAWLLTLRRRWPVGLTALDGLERACSSNFNPCFEVEVLGVDDIVVLWVDDVELVVINEVTSLKQLCATLAQSSFKVLESLCNVSGVGNESLLALSSGVVVRVVLFLLHLLHVSKQPPDQEVHEVLLLKQLDKTSKPGVHSLGLSL